MKRAFGIARSRTGRVGLVAAVIMATFLALSAPASAHQSVLSGSTVCSDGSHVVSWTIGNDWNTPMTITSASATIGGQTYAVTGYTSPVFFGSPTHATSTLPAGTGTVTLHVHGLWPADGVQTDNTTNVDLITNCHSGSTTTTAAPTTTAPAPTTTVVAPTTVTAAPTTTTAPPTSTTAAPTTTTAAPTTTSTAVSPTTIIGGPTTTTPVTGQGGTTTTIPCVTTTTAVSPTTIVGGPTTTTPVTGEGGPTTTTMLCVPTTTTVVVSPTTIFSGPTTTTPVTGQGGTTTTSDTPITGQGATSTTANVPLTQQAVPSTAPGATNLPETGSNTSLPVIFGAGCLAVGATLALRKRKTWTRP